MHVQLSFAAPSAAAKTSALTEVTVVVGSDKFSWPRIEAGQTQAVRLRPGPQDPRQLSLLYRLGEQRLAWTSPDLPAGQGVRFVIAIDASGRVEHRHCALPCSL